MHVHLVLQARIGTDTVVHYHRADRSRSLESRPVVHSLVLVDIVVRSDEDICHAGRRFSRSLVACLHRHIGFRISIHIVFRTRDQQQEYC